MGRSSSEKFARNVRKNLAQGKTPVLPCYNNGIEQSLGA